MSVGRLYSAMLRYYAIKQSEGHCDPDRPTVVGRQPQTAAVESHRGSAYSLASDSVR